jgi:predicted lipid-binding transport protein (Tim44 family)
MEGGFPYGDIIVIGAIAAFILLRYRAMLGESRGRDEQGPPPMGRVSEELERVIQLPAARAAAAEKKPEENYGEKYGSLAETFVAMRALDREFSPEEFLTGARMAYEMVITAFSKRDRDTLKMLLSDSLYKSFEQSLKDEESAKRFTDTTLVAISNAWVKEAKLNGTQATLSVEFVSDQIHLMRDAAGAIVEGDASAQNKVEDQWVFTRDLKSTSPNWTIIDT